MIMRGKLYVNSASPLNILVKDWKDTPWYTLIFLGHHWIAEDLWGPPGFVWFFWAKCVICICIFFVIVISVITAVLVMDVIL